jgi:Ca2+-binding RTX toxin-like protein
MATVNGTSNSETIDQDFVDLDGDSVSDAADTVFADPGDDTVFGFGGNDTLDGHDGDDIVIGGPGADPLFGGTGIDTASYANSPGAVEVSSLPLVIPS